ncbi:unnamed protein product, partial [Effrenium voratum]
CFGDQEASEACGGAGQELSAGGGGELGAGLQGPAGPGAGPTRRDPYFLLPGKDGGALRNFALRAECTHL